MGEGSDVAVHHDQPLGADVDVSGDGVAIQVEEVKVALVLPSGRPFDGREQPLVEALLLDWLIYIDWAAGYVPFNVLAVPGQPQSVARNALEAMCRVWPELRQAPTFQVLILSALTVLIQNRLPMTCLYQLLTDEDFRASCMAKVTDSLVHQSFETFAKLGRDQTQEAGSTLRRAFLLSFSPELRLTFGQPECWLDFRAILDSGRSFIINLGNVKDAETRRLTSAYNIKVDS